MFIRLTSILGVAALGLCGSLAGSANAQTYNSSNSDVFVPKNSPNMTWNRDCVPDTLKVVNSGDTTEMSCTLKDQFHNRSNQHMFSTRLFVTPKGESNTYEINLPEKGKDTAVWSAPAGSVFEYGGSMDVANGTQRVAVYTKTTSWDEAANLSKKCMPDDAFCFQIYGSVCIFSTSGLEWERSCPLYKSISFAAQPTEGKTPVIRNLGTRFESHLTLTSMVAVAFIYYLF